MEYVTYCSLLEDEIINEGILSNISDSVIGVFKNIKDQIIKISSKTGISILDIIKSLKQKEVYEFLKKIGFNFGKVLEFLKKAYDLVKSGIDKIFIEINKSKMLTQLKSGAMKIDMILEKYPLLKKVGGVALAGLLIYMWINMSFIGDFSDDFDITNVFNALSGTYTLEDLFLSPSGIKFITLFATGSLFSFPWMFGSFPISIIIALIYTGYKKLKQNPEILKKLRTNIKNIVAEELMRKKVKTIISEMYEKK